MARYSFPFERNRLVGVTGSGAAVATFALQGPLLDFMSQAYLRKQFPRLETMMVTPRQPGLRRTDYALTFKPAALSLGRPR
jgi:hypothetical protein